MRGFARIWLVLAVTVIAVGYLSTWYFSGFGAFLGLLNPFNFANYVVVVLVLSPWFGADALADRLDQRRKSDDVPIPRPPAT